MQRIFWTIQDLTIKDWAIWFHKMRSTGLKASFVKKSFMTGHEKGEKMTVADIQKFTVDKVCIYRETADFDFEDVFKGRASDIPKELLSVRIESVNAARKGLLDIRIARQIPSYT